MKSAVTVCLVPEMSRGPFVFHGDLPGACRTAAGLGFDAVEVFAGSGQELRALGLPALLAETGLTLAAVGTGAGFVKHGLTLTDPDPAVRQRALDYVRAMIDAAADLRTPVIVGSMQGRDPAGEKRGAAFDHLAEAITVLGLHAFDRDTLLLVEPLNRYESNILNTLADGVVLTKAGAGFGVNLLADLFHMNIEEADISAAITAAEDHIGHVHLADSNRLAPGLGHADLAAAVAALGHAGYDGTLSAEIFPGPDAFAAATQWMAGYRRLTAGAA